MPAPNEKSRLVKALATATGMSLTAIYTHLRDSSEPRNRLARDAWLKVLADRRATPANPQPMSA